MIQTSLCIVPKYLHSVCIHAECIPSGHDQEMMLVHQDQPASLINFIHMGATFGLFLVILMPSTYTDKHTLCLSEQKGIPKSVLFLHPVPIKFFRTVFPTLTLQVGVRVIFVQEELLGRQCLTMILAICVVEYVSTYLDTLSSLGASSIFT